LFGRAERWAVGVAPSWAERILFAATLDQMLTG